MAAASREYREIPIGLIDPPALASRAEMDEGKLEELAASIRHIGIIQPLVVGRAGDRYEIVAGHRRYMAARQVGMVAAPCIVYPSVSAATESIKFAENYYREDLNPADEAFWFCELLERDHGGDVDKLAAAFGLKRSYVEGRLVLLRGDARIVDAVQHDKIGVGVAEQLNRCTDPEYRRYLLHQAISGGATVAVVNGWIQDWQRAQSPASSPAAAAATEPPPGAAVVDNFFTCLICRGTEHVHLMRQINVHEYCRLAVLDKLLASYRGET